MHNDSNNSFWCTCAAYGCKDNYDASRGAYGIHLKTKRAHQQHHNADAQADLRKHAEALLADSLVKRDETIQLTLIQRPRAEEIANQVGVQKTLAILGQVTDDICRLKRDVEFLRVSKLDADHALDQCSLIRLQLSEQYQKWKTIVYGSYRRDKSVKEMQSQIKSHYYAADELLCACEKFWLAAQVREQSISGAESKNKYDSDHHFRPAFSGVKTLLQVVILMVVTCSVMLGLPRRGSTWIFSMVRYLIEIVISRIPLAHSQYFSQLVHGFPRDIRSTIDHFNLDTKSTIMAVCPSCNCTYTPEVCNGIPTYPKSCDYRSHGVRCGVTIVRPKRFGDTSIFVPIKPYVIFDMQDWMGGMLSREGLKIQLDNAWSRMSVSPDGILRDIFQGSTVRDFKGPDRYTHFSCSGEKDAGRYLFSLSFDFFNPLGNTKGKSISVGALILACLNIPIEMRYKPENLFIAGLIPGPNEPKLDSINHFLRPLTDVLLLFWSGIFFSRTSLFPKGRLILCAVIAVICDLPAARKLVGLGSYTHHYFCSMCWCNRLKQTYNDFNFASWIPKTNEQCRDAGACFRAAETEAEAKKLFDGSSFRWTELLRLPYFDPIKMTVIDPMHNLYLGVVMEHFRNILGFRPKSSQASNLSSDIPQNAVEIYIPPDTTNPMPSGRREAGSVHRLIKILSQQLNISPESEEGAILEKIGGKKSTIHLSALMYVARGLHLVEAGTEVGAEINQARYSKRILAQKLMDWRKVQEEQQVRPDTWLDLMRGKIFTAEDMKELWNDLKTIIKPTWVSSVPPTITSVGPKLKSDQWRSMATLYLPITLVRIWSNLDDDDEHSPQRRDLLHLTMLLCSAVAIAGSRTTSKLHAQLYMQYMVNYREELLRLFPSYQCLPNHHFSLHIQEFLLMYGPVHGWWTFPFERVNGMLQRMNNNYKEGEYEKTIATAWHRASNLRAFFAKSQCPQTIKYCYTMFSELVQTASRNSLVSNFGYDSDEDDDYYPNDHDEDMERVLFDAELNFNSNQSSNPFHYM